MKVTCGYSIEMAATTAVNQATVSIENPKTMVFFSPFIIFDEVTRILHEKYPDCDVCGATTAVSYQHDMNWDGNPEGFGLSVSAFGEDFECITGVIDDVDKINIDDAGEIRKKMNTLTNKSNTICFEMMNCLGKEETTLDILAEGTLGSDIPIVGGCAGNEYDNTDVLLSYNGEIIENGCIYIFIHNKRGRIKIIRGEICNATRRTLIPTDVDIEKRVVYEFDGIPAVTALCDELNLPMTRLEGELWRHPIGRLEGENWKITEVAGVTSDRGLSLGSTVYGGVGLQLLEYSDYEKRITEFCSRVAKEADKAEFCMFIVCKTLSLFLKNENWIYRMTNRFDSVFSQYTGFSGWGEQLGHDQLNHSLLAIAFFNE